MNEAFSQLGSISAVLGGFAFAFVGVLLARSDNARTVAWTAALALPAAACFILCALGWSLIGVWLAGAVANGVLAPGTRPPDDIAGLHSPLSLMLVVGFLLFLASLGLSGWTYSRRLGWVSTAVAVASLVLAALLFRPFVVVS